MTSPINIKKILGDCYRVVVDHAAKEEPNGRREPWYYQIPCKYGHIYPHSVRLLAFFCVGAGIRARLAREHPEIEAAQWGDDGEAVFLFTIEQFDIVAEYAQPRKKRRLSSEQRETLTKRLRDANRNPNSAHKSTLCDAQRDDLTPGGM